MSNSEDNKSQNIHDPIKTVDQDILQRRDIAQTILDRLIMSNPGAIGIYGGWGTGKTSLLNLLCKLNDKQQIEQSDRKDIHIEIIDAWKYESGDGLLMPVIVRFKQMADTTDFPEAWRVIMRRVLASTALSVTDALLKKYVGVDRKNIKENYEEIEKRDKQKDHAALLLEWEGWSDEIGNTASAFEEIVGFVLEKIGCERVVICIDNLDRCSPENVVHLLESVKNFFSVPNCTWVFAMDAEVIASYINHKYEGTRVDGNCYLDKIIPEQYHLSFFPDENDRRVFDLIRNATGSDLTLNDWRRLPLLPYVMVPRRLKKSAAKFAEYFDGTRSDAERDTVFLLSLLYHTWPDFYQRLSSASAEHVGGILANFFKLRNSDSVDMRWGKYSPLPLDKKFTEDQDLIFFLKTAFPENSAGAELVGEIRRAMDGLRQVGLP
jgi:hypothetical protein